MRLTSIESSFHPCNIDRDAIVPGAYPGEAKMCITANITLLFIAAGDIYTTELYVTT